MEEAADRLIKLCVEEVVLPRRRIGALGGTGDVGMMFLPCPPPPLFHLCICRVSFILMGGSLALLWEEEEDLGGCNVAWSRRVGGCAVLLALREVAALLLCSW